MKLSYKYFTFDVPLCLLRWLKRRMRWVRAAGGIVTSDEGRMLLIFRNGRWDLPKGKVEAGETLMRAAVREVQEETGLDRLQPGRLVTKTYHVYNLYGGWHLKQTSWFRMTTEGIAPETHPHPRSLSQGESVVILADRRRDRLIGIREHQIPRAGGLAVHILLDEHILQDENALARPHQRGKIRDGLSLAGGEGIFLPLFRFGQGDLLLLEEREKGVCIALQLEGQLQPKPFRGFGQAASRQEDGARIFLLLFC